MPSVRTKKPNPGVPIVIIIAQRYTINVSIVNICVCTSQSLYDKFFFFDRNLRLIILLNKYMLETFGEWSVYTAIYYVRGGGLGVCDNHYYRSNYHIIE